MRPASRSKSTTTPSAPAVAMRLSLPGAASIDRMPPCTWQQDPETAAAAAVQTCVLMVDGGLIDTASTTINQAAAGCLCLQLQCGSHRQARLQPLDFIL